MRGGKPPPRTATGPSILAAGRILFQRTGIVQPHSNNMTRQRFPFAYAKPGAVRDVIRSEAVEQSKTVSRVKNPS